MTENNFEEFDPFVPLPQIDEYSGGAVCGETHDGGGMVFFTRLGEFACNRLENGEYLAGFPGCGLICLYGKDGELKAVTLTLSDYLANLIRTGVAGELPNQGIDIDQVVKRLFGARTLANVTVKVQERVVEVTMVDGMGELIWQNSQNFNLESGLDANLAVDEIILPMKVLVSGDEFMIGLGESKGGQNGFAMLAIGKQVDFAGNFDTGNSLDIQKLADKVALN